LGSKVQKRRTGLGLQDGRREAVVKPITPAQAGYKKGKTIPDAVFNAFNQLIQEKLGEAGAVTIKQNEVMERILKLQPGLSRQEIFNKHWLDVEPFYRKAGWHVEYDKPGFNESYDAYFVFSARAGKGLDAILGAFS
jgi:hypothetical protein